MKTLSQSDAGNTKIVNLANGTASGDAAAFGQIPVIDTTATDIKALGTQAAGTSTKVPAADHVHPATGLADTTSTQSIGGVKTFTSALAPSGGITPASSFTAFGTGGIINGLNSSSGSNTVMAAGTWYYAALYIPFNVTLTGIHVAAGNVGLTDNWMVALWNSSGGTALANSATAGIAAPAANTKKAFAFTGTVAVTGPAVYFIGLQSNGTTAKFLAFGNAVEGFATGQTGGTFGTVISLTAPTTYSANLGPFASTY